MNVSSSKNFCPKREIYTREDNNHGNICEDKTMSPYNCPNFSLQKKEKYRSFSAVLHFPSVAPCGTEF